MDDEAYRAIKKKSAHALYDTQVRVTEFVEKRARNFPADRGVGVGGEIHAPAKPHH